MPTLKAWHDLKINFTISIFKLRPDSIGNIHCDVHINQLGHSESFCFPTYRNCETVSYSPTISVTNKRSYKV